MTRWQKWLAMVLDRIATWSTTITVKMRRPMIVQVSKRGLNDTTVDIYGGSRRHKKRMVRSIALESDPEHRMNIRLLGANDNYGNAAADICFFVANSQQANPWDVLAAVRRSARSCDTVRMLDN